MITPSEVTRIAIITNLRNPTPAMLAEGASILYREDDGEITQEELAARVFRGMCDAAIRESSYGRE